MSLPRGEGVTPRATFVPALPRGGNQDPARGVRRRAASLDPRYRDRGAGRPPALRPRRAQAGSSLLVPTGSAIPPPTMPGLHLQPYPQAPLENKQVQTRFDKTPPSLHRAPGGQTAIRLKLSPRSSEPCSSLWPPGEALNTQSYRVMFVPPRRKPKRTAFPHGGGAVRFS